MSEMNCLYCKQSFKTRGNEERKYCSNTCQGKHTVQVRMEEGNASPRTARKYMLENVEYKCSCCGISEWNGKPITLQMDHIDGDTKNNKLNNLRWLCPNCHTQTENWGSANIADDNRHKLRTNKVMRL